MKNEKEKLKTKRKNEKENENEKGEKELTIINPKGKKLSQALEELCDL